MSNFRLIFRFAQVSEFSHVASVVFGAGYLQDQGQNIESVKEEEKKRKKRYYAAKKCHIQKFRHF